MKIIRVERHKGAIVGDKNSKYCKGKCILRQQQATDFAVKELVAEIALNLVSSFTVQFIIHDFRCIEDCSLQGQLIRYQMVLISIISLKCGA